MNRTTLDADILRFCTHILADLGTPALQTEVTQMRPLKVRVGITIPDVPPEAVLAACTTSAMREACLSTWTTGFMVNCPPKSIALAADDQHVIFDLVFYSANLEIEDHLKPKA